MSHLKDYFFPWLFSVMTKHIRMEDLVQLVHAEDHFRVILWWANKEEEVLGLVEVSLHMMTGVKPISFVEVRSYTWNAGWSNIKQKNDLFSLACIKKCCYDSIHFTFAERGNESCGQAVVVWNRGPCKSITTGWVWDQLADKSQESATGIRIWKQIFSTSKDQRKKGKFCSGGMLAT